MRFPVMRFSSETDPNWDKSDDHTLAPRISLDAFYNSVAGFEITDAKALEYM